MSLSSLLRNGIFLGLTLALTGCTGEPKKPTTTIRLDGSSTVYPVAIGIAEEFQDTMKTNVIVGNSGTGGGFKKFVRGETDISNASRPISKNEIDECQKAGVEFLELPVCYDALTVVVHPENPLSEISTAELKKMWEEGAEGKITTWDQVNPSFPKEKLTLFAPGRDSGTFDYFVETVVGSKEKKCRNDFTPSENDNILIQGVSGDKHALAYFGFAYYELNKSKLKALAIVDSSKPAAKGVAPSMETVLNGSYVPLSRPLFIYVNKKSLEKPEVKQFVEFLLKNVGKFASDVKYVPLPAKVYELVNQRYQTGEVGSTFSTAPHGSTVEEGLKLKKS